MKDDATSGRDTAEAILPLGGSDTHNDQGSSYLRKGGMLSLEACSIPQSSLAVGNVPQDRTRTTISLDGLLPRQDTPKPLFVNTDDGDEGKVGAHVAFMAARDDGRGVPKAQPTPIPTHDDLEPDPARVRQIGARAATEERARQVAGRISRERAEIPATRPAFANINRNAAVELILS